MDKNNKYEDFPGVHHFYLGIFYILVGFFLVWVHWIPSVFFELLGLWFILDDYAQHMKNQIIKKHNEKVKEEFLGLHQAVQRPYKELYKSFLHRKFVFFWKFKIVRKITGFFDWLFGR